MSEYNAFVPLIAAEIIFERPTKLKRKSAAASYMWNRAFDLFCGSGLDALAITVHILLQYICFLLGLPTAAQASGTCCCLGQQ